MRITRYYWYVVTGKYNKKHRKIGEWSVELDNKKDIAVIERYLKFRFYDAFMRYDTKAYCPIERKFDRALDGYENICVIDNSKLIVHFKGISNLEAIIATLDKVFDELEAEYGQEYKKPRKRAYRKKKE